MVTPSGDLALTPSKPTVVDLEKGSKVFTADETKNMLGAFNNGAAQLVAPSPDNGITPADLQRHGDQITEAFESQAQHITTIGRRGVEEFMKHNGNKTKYYNERYR